MKKVAGGLVLAILAGMGILAYETRFLHVEHVEVPIPGLPSAFKGFRIAHLSDLHGIAFSPTGQLAQEIERAQPDLIAVTGDFVHRKASDIHEVIPLLEAMTKVAPVFAVSGNHDHWTDWPYIAGRLTAAGTQVLDNSHTVVERERSQIVVAGVCDPHTGNDDVAETLPEEIHAPVVLLAHSPTWFEPPYVERFSDTPEFRQQRERLEHVALTLVGHTHGGQIKLPFVGPLTTASGRLFPRTHIQGLMNEHHGWLYITRGVGQGSPIPLRFLSRRELTLITLVEK